MDFDALDATQAIYEEEFDDETDEDLSESQRKPVAYLIVEEQKGLQHKQYPVYEGDNIIGRQESCQICIPSKSLSKEHACITVKSGNHLIFDKGSRNKTKRGKLFLSPEVRYELQDQNKLLFADVRCTYSTVTKDQNDGVSGSGTEEEKADCPQKPGPLPRRDENSNKQYGTALSRQSCEGDFNSDDSIDLLMPTQPYDSSTCGSSAIGGYTDDSPSTTVMETPDFLKKPVAGITEGSLSPAVLETPDFLKKIDVGATLVLSDSGSETDEEELSDLPPQTLVFQDDDGKTQNESAILRAATQAMGGGKGCLVDETQLYSSDADDRLSGSEVDFEAATQALHRGPSPKRKGGPFKKSSPRAGNAKGRSSQRNIKKGMEVERTQAYEMGSYNDSDSDVKKMSPSKKLKIISMETQKVEDARASDSEKNEAYEMGSYDDSDSDVKKMSPSKKLKIISMETQKIENARAYNSEDEDADVKKVTPCRKSQITSMETQKIGDITSDESDTEDDSKASISKAISMLETQKMDTAEDSIEKNNDEKMAADETQLSGFFSTSTLACEVSDEESDDDGGKHVKAKVNFNDATHAIGGTVILEDEVERVPERGNGPKCSTVTENGDATVPVNDATVPVDGKGEKGDDSMMPVRTNDATVTMDANDATMPISTDDAMMPINANDGTMPISADDATLPMEENVTDDNTSIGKSKPQDAIRPMDKETAIVPAPETVPALHTQPVSDTIAIIDTVAVTHAVPKTSTRGRKSKKLPSAALSDTLPISDTVAVTDTLPVSNTLQKTSSRGRRGRKPLITAVDTLPVGPDMNSDKQEETQPAGDDQKYGIQEFGTGDAGKAKDTSAADTLPVSGDEDGGDSGGGTAGGADDAGDTIPLAEDEASVSLFLPQITRSIDLSDDDSTSEMVPESQHGEECISIIKLPDRSPLKSALVDPATCSRSPSPRRVAFAQPEEPEEEAHQETASSRGRKRGMAVRSKPTTPVPQRGRRAVVKKASARDRSEDDVTKDESNLTEGQAKPRNEDNIEETGTDAADMSSGGNTRVTEKAATRAKCGASTAVTSRGHGKSRSETRRSGRARKPTRFADDSEEEKEESGEQKDRETADIASAPPQQSRKGTSGGKGSRSSSHEADANQQSEGMLQRHRIANKRLLSPLYPSVSSELAPAMSDVPKSDDSAKDEEDLPKVQDRDQPETEAVEDHQQELIENKTAGKSKRSRTGKRSAVQTQAGAKVGGEQTAKKAKLSPDTSTDQPKHKGEDTREREEKLTNTEGGKTTSATEEEECAEVIWAKVGSQGSRKSSRHAADDAKLMDTEPSRQGGSSRSRGRASRQIEASQDREEKPDSVSKSRRGIRGVKKSAELEKAEAEEAAARESEESKTEAEDTAPAESEESQELPAISKENRKIAEEEHMDTEDLPELAADVMQEDSGSSRRRSRAQTAKKSQHKEHEAEMENATKAKVSHHRGSRSQIPSAADASKSTDEETESSVSSRSRTARSKLGVSSKVDGMSQEKSELGGSSHTDPDSSAAVSSRKRGRKSQVEDVTFENSQGSAVNRLGWQSPRTDKAGQTDSKSTRRRGHGRQKDLYLEEEDSAGTEEHTQSSVKDTETIPSSAKVQRCRKSLEAEMAEAAVNGKGRIQKSLRGDTAASEHCQSESDIHSSATRSRLQAKSASEDKDASAVEASEESIQDQTPRRGQQTKTQSESMELKDSQNDDHAPRRRRRYNKASELAEENNSQDGDHAAGRKGLHDKISGLTKGKDSQDHHHIPTKRGRQTKTPSELVEVKESQCPEPTPGRGKKMTKTDSDSRGDQNSQDSTASTRISRRTRKAQDRDAGESSAEHEEEDSDSEKFTPLRRHQNGKKTQNTEEDTAQSESQDTQQSTVQSGRRGKRSQKADSVDATTDSATEKNTDPAAEGTPDNEPKCGDKRRATLTKAASSDVADSETGEPEDGLTAQKRGTRGNAVTETSEKESPAPAKRGRHSMILGGATPVHAGPKSKLESVHSPSLRRTSLTAKPRVIFTGVIDDQGEKIVKELGGDIVQSVQDCTHLVTDKIRRTVKFLAGVARGVSICTLQWLVSCKSSGMFVDASRFMVEDSSSEKQYKFNLHSSLHKAAQSPMLAGYRIHVTKSVRPEPQQMKEILQCAGAEWLSAMPKKAAEKTVVISCEENKNACQPALNAGIDVVSAEFILTGVLRQEVDIDGFRLFGSSSSSSRSRR